MNDSPPTDDDDSATVAEFFESMLENGGAMSLPLGLTLSFDTSEQRYVIQQGDIIIERRVTLVNIIEAAKEIGAW